MAESFNKFCWRTTNVRCTKLLKLSAFSILSGLLCFKNFLKVPFEGAHKCALHKTIETFRLFYLFETSMIQNFLKVPFEGARHSTSS